ncbi:MAG: DNA replication protein DnaD, partial [Oscillospiraceae bacterium]|nr:DNA replication protein DnaD [Oscillospiraceae bacterium]
MYTTGIPTCDQLREVAFTGNVIPQIWYRVFVKSDLKHPKPHLLAINILADIVYWYRPREIRDEGSGQIIGYQKKFRDDLLQRSYAQ